jgi:hypothetical protein
MDKESQPDEFEDSYFNQDLKFKKERKFQNPRTLCEHKELKSFIDEHYEFHKR